MADSLTKTRARIEELADKHLPAHFATMAVGMITLPDTSQELDDQLEAFARELLEMRSDTAPTLTVIHA